MSHAIQTTNITANGLRLAVRSCGEGPVVLCLHGFPDSAQTWDTLLVQLANAGYRGVAPSMRGYRPSDVPTDDRFDAATLGQDVLALAERFSPEEPVYLVGHDWGAVAAYAAAAEAPQRIRAMVTVAVPPMRCFLANLRPAQIRRSWYMLFFQFPGIAERALAANDMALIDHLWRDWSPQWSYSAADIAPAKQALADPAARRAALRYYRALAPTLLRGKQRRALMEWQTTVATRIVYGTQDGCIGPALFKNCARCFKGDFDLHALEAGHFLHREKPQVFADLVLSWIAKASEQHAELS